MKVRAKLVLRVACQACGTEYRTAHTDANKWRCPNCQGDDLEVYSLRGTVAVAPDMRMTDDGQVIDIGGGFFVEMAGGGRRSIPVRRIKERRSQRRW